jgi:Holliday junction resolvase RusA-like endonuclease
MEIIIPFKTPSVNHLYFNFRGFQRLTKEARVLQLKIAEIVNEQKREQYIWTGEVTPKLKVQIDIYENWNCKDGSVKKKDLANREKFLVDAVMESLGIEDKFIFQETMRKIQSDVEQAVIKIEVLNENM